MMVSRVAIDMDPVLSINEAGDGAIHLIATDPRSMLSGVALIMHPRLPGELERGRLLALSKLIQMHEFVLAHTPARSN